MYIIKNAFKNLLRNKGRNGLVGSILLVLIVATTVALVINTTTKGIINDYKNRFGSTASLSVDFDKLMNDQEPNAEGSLSFPSAPEITPQQYVDFAKSKYLKSYQLDMLASIAFDELKPVGEQDNNQAIGSIGGNNNDYISPQAKLLSYSNLNKIPDFSEGLRKIVEGKTFKKDNECIISSDFAELNNLKVGDKISVKDTISKKTFSLNVSGIYADATKATANLPSGSFSLEGSFGNRRNEIIVNRKTMESNLDINNLSVNAKYELKSPEVVKDFENEIREKGLPDVYNVETDEASYNKIVAPVVGLSETSITFMWVVLVIGGVVLLFITAMAIRERKYEIGVLRAMGMKRLKVAIMFVIEMLILTTLCLGIGLAIGASVSQPIADTLIENQAKVTEPQQSVGNYTQSIGMGSPETNDVEPLSTIDVSLTVEAITQIILIALLLALLSSTAGVIYITKYEPMKILFERN